MDNTEPTTPATEQSVAPTPVESHEASMFEKHVIANNVKVPDNFKSVGDWFNALKSAQGAYTQARQEISQLKKQLEPPMEKPAEQEAPVPKIPEELRIPDKPIPEKPTADAPKEALTKEEWSAFSTEFAVNGSLSETSLASIREKTKLPDFVISEFLEGQKARLQQAYDKAALSVGGKDQMARIFDWASKNLSEVELKNVNAALSTPSWEVALLGLQAKYSSAQPKKVTANEPPKGGNAKVGVGSSVINNGPYANKAEFYKDRSDPRFQIDNQFRNAVELRMSKTNFNNLK